MIDESEVIRDRVGEGLELVGKKCIDWKIRVTQSFIEELKMAIAKIYKYNVDDLEILCIKVEYRVSGYERDITIY